MLDAGFHLFLRNWVLALWSLILVVLIIAFFVFSQPRAAPTYTPSTVTETITKPYDDDDDDTQPVIDDDGNIYIWGVNSIGSLAWYCCDSSCSYYALE